MMNNENIYDIIANLLLGTITDEEQKELDEWLNESDENKVLFEQFMQRNDMAEVYNVMANIDSKKANSTEVIGKKNTNNTEPTGKKNALLSNRRNRNLAMISVAASLLLGIGLYMWHAYTAVVAPELDQMSLAAITSAEREGRAGANVVIYDENGAAIETVQQVVEQNASIDEIYDMVKTKFVSHTENYTATISTEDDKEFWMTLSDGSRVHLNNNSTLTYPIVFHGKAREVTLEGEAYFSIAKDRRHPFIVHTQFGDVKEYGTEFVVNTCFDSSESPAKDMIVGRGMSVVLVEGSISITPKNGKEHMMEPNELAVVPFGGRSCLMKTVDATPYASWNTGTFSFDCCPMENLMDVIGRWYKLDVEYAHDGYRKIQFTGELDRYDGIEDDLNAINQITGMNLKVVDGKIIVE